MKLTIDEAAQKFKISKEAIHNRIRRGSLDCVIEHGTKLVLIDEPVSNKSSDDKYYSYIEEENSELKQRVKELEKSNSSLRDEKEKMLILEKEKIEQIYKQRDEQLKQVLHTITSKFLPNIAEKEVDSVADDIVDVETIKSEPVRLKVFLKLKAYKPAKRLRIKNRFKRLIGRDERVYRREGKVYIDPSRFDYKDLLK